MYKCICGKEFDKPNSFNAHKSHCKKHFINKYGSDKEFVSLNSERGLKGAIANAKNSKQRKKVELDNWIKEQHTCEHCGKIMTEKFGSGRFCSRACANSRAVSPETKQKIQAGTKLYYNSEEGINKLNLARAKSVKVIKMKSLQNAANREHIFSTCAYCGKQIDITDKVKNGAIRHYCDGTCRNLHLNKLKEIGGLFNGYGISKWELELQNLLTKYNITFEANKRDLLPSGLEVDIWLPDFNIAIELNGIYHYSTKPYNGNQDALNKRQQKDLLKKAQCESLGYKLFVFEDRLIDNTYEFFKQFIEKELLKLH